MHFLLSDGKFHVLPLGDLHILRADASDSEVAYACLVRNTLTGVEEPSAPFHLQMDGECLFTDFFLYNILFFL